MKRKSICFPESEDEEEEVPMSKLITIKKHPILICVKKKRTAKKSTNEQEAFFIYINLKLRLVTFRIAPSLTSVKYQHKQF